MRASARNGKALLEALPRWVLHAKHILEYEIDRDTLRKRLQNLYFQGYGLITKLDVVLSDGESDRLKTIIAFCDGRQ